ELGADRARPGDAVLISGLIGDHGAAVLDARGELALSAPIKSDCAPLNRLVEKLIVAVPSIRFMRDATRVGLASGLNEGAGASGIGIEINEPAIPIRAEVRGFCEILGLDPLYLANEGNIVCVVPAGTETSALAALRSHPLGANAAIIGAI